MCGAPVAIFSFLFNDVGKFFIHAANKTYAVTNESPSHSAVTQMKKYGDRKGKVMKLIIIDHYLKTNYWFLVFSKH